MTSPDSGTGGRCSSTAKSACRPQTASDRLALILIDLDNFKEINDTLGHHAGDRLLRETARRLAARVSHPRSARPPGR